MTQRKATEDQKHISGVYDSASTSFTLEKEQEMRFAIRNVVFNHLITTHYHVTQIAYNTSQVGSLI